MVVAQSPFVSEGAGYVRVGLAMNRRWGDEAGGWRG